MKLYIISLYLILVGICRAVQLDSICNSDKRIIARQITLTGYNNDIGQCECQITLQNTGSTIQQPHRNITVTQTHLFDTCNYKLFYHWDGNNIKTDQNNHKNSTFTLELNGTLYVGMENLLNGYGHLCLIISVTTQSPAWNINLTCNNLNKSTNTSVISTTTAIVSQSQTVDTITATMSTTDHADGDNNNLLPIILGCSVGGTVLIILLVVIIGCVVFRRQQTKISSENSHHGDMVVIKNNINVSSNSIPNKNNEHGTKYMAEMEIIPNDLYQSSDPLADDLNRLEQLEHVPEQQAQGFGFVAHVPEQLEHGTKDKPVMEIIPNDLYQSSDSLADDLNRLRQLEHVPEQLEHGNKDKPVIEIIPNDLYQSSDSLADDLNRLRQLEHVPEQHAHGVDLNESGQHEHVPKQLEHETKNKPVMEIIPNDLYQSLDSLSDDSNESEQHEHVPEQLQHETKDKAVMEIIPNDLYQSSDSLSDDLNRLRQLEHIPKQHAPVPGQLEHVSYTNPEYTLVNKKPKKVPNRMKINQNLNKIQADYENIEKEKKTIKLEIDRIVGPKGDDYTLVNKC